MPTNDAPMQVSKTTARLIALLGSRDATGLRKYGQTLDRPDLSLEDWLQHMTEELLDAAGYAQAALRTLREGGGLQTVVETHPRPRITLTLEQIIDLAEFAGLNVAKDTEDDADTEYHVYNCPPEGVLNEGEPGDAGSRAHYEYVVVSGEYPDEGCVGLGPEVIPTGGHSPPVIAR